MTLIGRNRAASNIAVSAMPLATPASRPRTKVRAVGSGASCARSSAAAAATAAACPTARTADGVLVRLRTGPR
jgi:hypothetical protein